MDFSKCIQAGWGNLLWFHLLVLFLSARFPIIQAGRFWRVSPSRISDTESPPANSCHSTNNPYISQLTNQLSSAQEQVTTLNTTLNCNCTEFANQGACAEITDSSSEPQQNTAALPNRLASLGDLPDYAVTLGEIALPDLVSDASKKIEALPYGVDIVAGYGCDFMVQNLVTKLHEAGLIKNVQTGASVYGNR